MERRFGEKGRTPYDGLRPFSALTHGVGIGFALLTMAMLLHAAIVAGGEAVTITAVSVYSASMLCLYTASTVYHSWRTGVQGRHILRKIDHVMIYFLIAGTYTPICAISLGGFLSGRVMLTVIWAVAVAGTVCTLFWVNMPRALTAGIYLVMGWTALFAIFPLHQVMTTLEFAMLLSGGGFYTLGGILYALKWPGRNNPLFGCHEVFHVLIVLGSICHFVMVYALVR